MNFENRYISKQEILEYKEKTRKEYEILRKKIFILNKEKRIFYKQYKNMDKMIKKQNDQFLKKELEETEELFKNVNGYKLDLEQVTSILKEEDSNLIIAGAGSGKTLTMIGKIKYLIERKGIEPSKILCLSFTNTITNDFLKSLEQMNYKVDVLTFHKLGIKIFNLNKINVHVIDENILDKVIDNYFYQKDKDFHKILNKFFNMPKDYLELKKLIHTFINLFKANNYKEEHWEYIENKVKVEPNRFMKKRNLFLITIIKEIYIKYTSILEENGQIDFNDMINEATELIKEGYLYPKYDYIIIDEYQDTSFTRYYLLKELKEKNHCHLLAVGDDWQSIYRFTGCNLEIFTEFNKYFPNSSISKIQTTYRNCQELIDVAGSFIMKNKKQFKKNLKSNKHIKKPIKIFLYDKKEQFSELLDYILSPVGNLEIFILGRNNNDLKFLEKNDDYEYQDDILIYKKYPSNLLRYFTVHKSKGLQCDKVILVNLENNLLGFPNQMNDDPILKYMSNKDFFPYEEERRLFYVALTRTKNEVYLFTPKKNKSIFVEEIIRDYPSKIEFINHKKYML